MVLFLGYTSSEGLALRFRLQKIGKRNLNWNVKPQRWKERNLRRGASPALRAMLTGKEEAEEDVRIKYLVTSDRKYIEKSLLLHFHTFEFGQRRALLLNLRKGYFKIGGTFGTKIYLSQVQAPPPQKKIPSPASSC